MASPRRSFAAGLGAVGIAVAVLAPGFTASASVPKDASGAAPPAPCASPLVPAPRDPSNPLALATAPGADPLHGAHFFVDGPRHGAVAQEIETLLGLDNATYSNSDTWASFRAAVSKRLHSVSTGLARQVRNYFKIGDQEETQSVSLYAEGGGYNGIFGQVTKLLCGNMLADPAPVTVPVFTTFFAYPGGHFCPTASVLQAWWPTFKADVDGMAAAIGSRRAVILTEIDSVGTIACLKGAALAAWLQELTYEIGVFSQLPHAVVYQEAGSEDETPASRVASLLVQVGVDRIRGFFTNDTHMNWSSKEIRWGDTVASEVTRLYQAQHPSVSYTPHFAVNTAQNGRGPKLNRHPARQGVEDLCNPPGRGLGRRPTGNTSPTFDGHRLGLLDGFLWTGVPGRSHGTTCYPDAKPAGVFDPRFALELAENANQKLGPGYRSQPY